MVDEETRKIKAAHEEEMRRQRALMEKENNRLKTLADEKEAAMASVTKFGKISPL